MTKLPRGLSGRQVRRALERAGFYLKRQKGSHMVLRRDDPFAQVVVPAHASIDTGTPASIRDAAGITGEQLRQLL
ncbi:MAG: type II toxin-antitoxin system HicA family toxin [Candidatus Rokubacteria bacterium]|nr:type II toxin-antitoxin system HicA family toxin [Candidatus Rokubacteria bacterium]